MVYGPYALLALAVAALLAGCAGNAPPLQSGDNAAPEGPVPDAGGSDAAAQEGLESVLVPVASLSLDGCAGVTTFAYVASDVVGLEPPTGWDMGVAPVNELRVDAYVCERVSIGPFERGPVGLALEFFGLADGPSACLEGDYDTLETPASVWTTDAEVAAYLLGLGLPASTAAIGFTTEETPALTAVHWSIADPGRFEARLDPSWTGSPSWGVTPHVYRLAWANPLGGVTLLDLELEMTADMNAPRLVTGALPEPFLYSRNGTEAFAGYGSALPEASGRGMLQEFGDPACETPA